MVMDDTTQYLQSDTDIQDPSRVINGSGIEGDTGKYGYLRLSKRTLFGLATRVKSFRAVFSVTGSASGPDMETKPFTCSNTYVRPFWAINGFTDNSFNNVFYPFVDGEYRHYDLPDNDALAKRLIIPYFCGKLPDRQYSPTLWPYKDFLGYGRMFNFNLTMPSPNYFFFSGPNLMFFHPLDFFEPERSQFPELHARRNNLRAFGGTQTSGSYHTKISGNPTEVWYSPRIMVAGSHIMSSENTPPSEFDDYDVVTVDVNFFGMPLYAFWIYPNPDVSFSGGGTITFTVEEEWDW